MVKPTNERPVIPFGTLYPFPVDAFTSLDHRLRDLNLIVCAGLSAAIYHIQPLLRKSYNSQSFQWGEVELTRRAPNGSKPLKEDMNKGHLVVAWPRWIRDRLALNLVSAAKLLIRSS